MYITASTMSVKIKIDTFFYSNVIQNPKYLKFYIHRTAAGPHIAVKNSDLSQQDPKVLIIARFPINVSCFIYRFIFL